MNKRTGLLYFYKEIYDHQVESSIKRGHKKPEYTKDEFRIWLYSHEDFPKLYDKWVKYSYKKDLKPSVDRLDDYAGYSFNNIQLTTWRDNYLKRASDMVSGKNNKKSKAVLQYNNNGVFIKEYYSMMQAERETGISNSKISMVCKGKRNSAGNFIWQYKKV